MVFDFNNATPIYMQIVEKLKIAIISGELKSGERLPSVRELALASQVNPNTMQKALGDLEELGLIFTERTNGKFVTNDTSLIDYFKQKYAEDLTLTYLKNMQNIGYLANDIAEQLKKFGGNKWTRY